jgi:hypothetical protein
MSIRLVDRSPTESEIERFRLFLSSYQDRLGNPIDGDPVHSWILKEVLIAAFNLPTDEQISPYRFPSGSPVVSREGNYQIHFKSLFSDELEDFCRESLVCSITPSKYWEYLAQCSIMQQNYQEIPSQVGSASIELMKREEKIEFEKIFYLFLIIDQDRPSYVQSREREIRFCLAQYSYSIDSYLDDLAALRWITSEASDSDVRLTFGGRRKFATFLRGYEHNDLVCEIKIPEPEEEPIWVSKTPLPGRKKQKITRTNMLEYELRRSRLSDQTIKIQLFLPPSKRIWQSDLLQVEKLSKLQIMEYGAIAALKKQREAVVAQLEELIKSDAREEVFQQLLEKNWWMFGKEYGEVIGQREIAVGTQQDFLAKRTADGFLEIIEIKKPLNGKDLIYRTNQGSHARSHYRQELSDAIAQVIDYIDDIENNKHSIYYKEKIEVEKIRAKIIIGRDGDEKQKRSLRHLNSALHGIEILTYDQLLRIAKKSLEYQ